MIQPLVFVAIAAVPTLLAFNEPPSPTFLNQAAALGLWGVVVAFLAQQRRSSWKQGASLLAALALVALAVAAASVWSELPSGLALSAAGLVAATMAVAASGVATGRSPGGTHALTWFFTAWLLAGLLSAAIGVVQVFLPNLPDGDLIARSGLAGRAVGNVRQPNHLSSLLLWSAVAVIPLSQAGRLRGSKAMSLFAFMMFGLVLSGSRTGMVGVLALTLWGVLDGRLGRTARAVLLSAPLWFGVFWVLMWLWARETQNTFGAAAHVLGAELSSSRFAIWSNTLSLIAQHPWTGVGFGEFNFTWSLSPFPQRPVAFFDHTHNLPLQLAVELGLPLAALVIALLGRALWRACRNSMSADGDAGAGIRAALVMVLMMALHSMLEYPLWYAYFLLPTAWAWGYCLGGADADRDKGIALRGFSWLRAGGLAMVLGAAIGVADYWRVVQIFAPSDDAPSLSQRIAAGQKSLLFSHHADYAAVTTADEPVLDPHAFDRAPHYLLDTRLMIAWAKSFAAQGKLDHARHLAQRLREFRNDASDEFFAPCDGPAPQPFQCQPPSRDIDWREFR